jgi:hypothetical protein
MLNFPVSLVSVVRMWPVAALTADTDAPLVTPPDTSRTVPATVPDESCARHKPGTRRQPLAAATMSLSRIAASWFKNRYVTPRHTARHPHADARHAP